MRFGCPRLLLNPRRCLIFVSTFSIFFLLVILLNFNAYRSISTDESISFEVGASLPPTTLKKPVESYDDILQDLEEAMWHSWKAYKDYAWGMDEVNVLSRTGKYWMNAALTMIDCLDTLWIFNMTNEFRDARNWIAENVHFDSDRDRTSVFETTIRILGGLLSAFHLSGDEIFLTKASLLGKKLLHAFDSQSGLPLTDINLATLNTALPSWGKYVSLAEATSIQLEFNDLAITLKEEYISRKGSKAQWVVHEQPKENGLMSIFLDIQTGRPTNAKLITLGARGDSYYEYLIKTWVQTGKRVDWLQSDYRAAVEGIKSQLLRHSLPSNFAFLGELHSGSFSPKMDHLVCFLPGTLAYGYLHGMPASDLKLAKALIRTCVATYRETVTGLSPEISHFNQLPSKMKDIYVKVADSHNILRPETVESLFYLYRITKDPLYRAWGKDIFYAFQNYTRLPSAGYASLKDVNNPSKGHMDKMESFWMAETLKYLYLLFNDKAAAQFNLKSWVFSTEAHSFPIATSAADIDLLVRAYTY